MVVSTRFAVAALLATALSAGSILAAITPQPTAAPDGELCGICTPSGFGVSAVPASSNLEFVGIFFSLGAGACEWIDPDCVPRPLDGCFYLVAGNWSRTNQPLGPTIAATALAKPDCGASGNGVDSSIGGTLTVWVTCSPCLEGPG
ncbi:MAG: hypothetical protein ACI9K5_003819 [Gammaproteobacteria bacterium]|jgi:hypothetical protein